MFDLEKITRKNVRLMKAYSSARDEFKGQADIWLDANENPNESNLNRYPDPLQLSLKKKIAEQKKLPAEQIFVGNGSDEAIDLLFRAFCEPGQSKAILFPPTYGMYEVSAAINNIEVVEIPITNRFEIPQLDVIKPFLNCTGLLFICSPNNPTGNCTSSEAIIEIAKNFDGLVIVDEAYVDFSNAESATALIETTPNLVVLQTFSKAYGLAGARVGMALANAEIISVLNKIKPPYNMNTLSISAASEALENQSVINSQIQTIQSERERMKAELFELNNVVQVYPSEANFLLTEFTDSEKVFSALLNEGIVVRNRNSAIKNCLRISLGTPTENNQLITTLNKLQS
jgi:histidinol-phosphate aminotransferase